MIQPATPSHRLHRLKRTADMIRHELALILKKANDPRFSQITITHVQLSNDFGHARIFFTVLDLDKENLSSIQVALKKAKGFLRYKLAHSASFRSTPTLEFVYTQHTISNLNDR